MTSKRIVVLGGGFAGLWSAVGAARKLDELGWGPDQAEVTLVNRDAFHAIRVRNYEADLAPLRVPLDDVLGPAGIRRVEGEVAGIDTSGQCVVLSSADGPLTLPYDRLVFALGSRLVRPPITGLAEHAFDVDTYAGAARLGAHFQSLPQQSDSPGRFTVVIVGAGLTGIELAAEMPGRLSGILVSAGLDRPLRVVLVDHHPRVGADMGESARPVIEQALSALTIETRVGVEVVSIARDGIRLRSGEAIPAATVVWCAGMEASPLTRLLPVERDYCGRIAVDEFMRVKGLGNIFAAGDVASARVDDGHRSVMSCQHSRPMGRFAGHNVVCDLFGLPLLLLHLPGYVTVLDLGAWGALYTEGWDRRVVAQGDAAKRTKQLINGQRIYPPLSRDRQEIFAAAAPVVQPAPAVDS